MQSAQYTFLTLPDGTPAPSAANPVLYASWNSTVIKVDIASGTVLATSNFSAAAAGGWPQGTSWWSAPDFGGFVDEAAGVGYFLCPETFSQGPSWPDQTTCQVQFSLQDLSIKQVTQARVSVTATGWENAATAATFTQQPPSTPTLPMYLSAGFWLTGWDNSNVVQISWAPQQMQDDTALSTE